MIVIGSAATGCATSILAGSRIYMGSAKAEDSKRLMESGTFYIDSSDNSVFTRHSGDSYGD
jgi:hypothetical protein